MDPKVMIFLRKTKNIIKVEFIKNKKKLFKDVIIILDDVNEKCGSFSEEVTFLLQLLTKK